MKISTKRSAAATIVASLALVACTRTEDGVRFEGDEAAARVEEAGMRALPMLGQFDLVWCLDDAVNYLLSVDELTSCLAGLRRKLDRAVQSEDFERAAQIRDEIRNLEGAR